MRTLFSRSTTGSDSFATPRHISALCQSGIPTENVPDILGNLRKLYGSKGYALNEVQSNGKTVYAILTKDNLRVPIVENI